jgi:hypothetical protein
MMPTGYTAKLMESGQSFQEFAMLCARAFGACVEMRDEPFDAPIPEKFEASEYSVKGLAEAQAEHARLLAMDTDQRIAFGIGQRSQSIASATRYLEKAKLENARLEEVEKQAAAWTPPTPEHAGLKKFMLQQISISKNTIRYSEESLAEAENTAPVDYFSAAVKSQEWSIAHHSKSMREDVDRAKGRTEWVKQLRASLS